MFPLWVKRLFCSGVVKYKSLDDAFEAVAKWKGVDFDVRDSSLEGRFARLDFSLDGMRNGYFTSDFEIVEHGHGWRTIRQVYFVDYSKV